MCMIRRPPRSTYAARLKELSVEPELTAEVLKLSFIRAQKGIRFKYALWATAGVLRLRFLHVSDAT